MFGRRKLGFVCNLCGKLPAASKRRISASGFMRDEKVVVPGNPALGDQAESRRPSTHDWNNMTSIAADELDQHREIRGYYRKIAWELPQLSEFATEYKPPSESEILQFRQTTYLGEDNPGSDKVCLEVKTKDLKLTQSQLHKLRVVAGQRYSLNTDVLKMSSDKFPNPLQNKLHLCETLDRLIAEAKDQSEDFKDLPIDTRHIRRRSKKPSFPKEWRRPQDAPGSNNRTISSS